MLDFAIRSRCIAALLTVLFVAGCRQSDDLAAVRTFAGAAHEVRPAYDSIAIDYRDSCRRRATLQRVAIAVTAELDRAAPAGARPSEDPCDAAVAITRQWVDRNDILLGYFSALGQLAGDADSSDRYGLAPLAASLESNGAFANEAQTKAFGSLADDVVARLFAARRRSEIVRDLGDAAPLVGQIVAQLSSVARINYARQLRLERDALADLRSEDLGLARQTRGAFDAYAFARSVRADDEELTARETAGAAYVDSLAALDRANGALIAALQRDDPSAATDAARAFAADVRSRLAVLSRATGAEVP